MKITAKSLPLLLPLLLLLPNLEAARYRFEAESDFTHTVGRAAPGAWSADPGLDPAGYMMLGPGTPLMHAGFAQVRVRAKTPATIGANDVLFRIDAVDRSNGFVLASRDVRHQEFPGVDTWRTFLLEFITSPDRQIDFNVWFHDNHTVVIDWVDALTDDRELSRYGINAHVPDFQRVDLAATANLRWLRVAFNWIDMEPQKGSFYWNPWDDAVNDALSRGQHVLATLAYTPAWATSGTPSTSPPDDIGDWYNYVYWTVDHFKDRVKYWSIWNEPNLPQFWSGTRGDYINMLKVAAQAVRAADPEAFVVGPELSDLNNWETWLDEILSYCRPEIDIVAHHIYEDNVGEILRMLEGPRYPWEDRAVKEIMEDNGMGSTPVWLTETGWESDTWGESTQALRLQQILGEMKLRPWWSKTFIYELWDPPPSYGFTWGILRDDLSKKPAYDATWEAALDGANEAWILAGPGAGPNNPNYVTGFTWDGQSTMWLAAYGATGYGTRVTSGGLDAAVRQLVITGPGPGAIYGPQVRAFDDKGAPFSKVNFYAYGTLKFGVNVATGDIDGDYLDEIISGGGPGVVFGPHVRGWNYDGVRLSSIGGINYFAYGPLRYGVNITTGSPDLDFYAEIVTGTGPSASYAGDVRGWNFDGVRISGINGLTFTAFPAGSYGCEVAAPDLVGDGVSEIVAAAGPHPGVNLDVRTFTFDSQGIQSYWDVVPLSGTLYGGKVHEAEIDGGGALELLASPGPDPSAAAQVAAISIPPSGPVMVPGYAPFTPYPTIAYGVNVGSLRLR